MSMSVGFLLLSILGLGGCAVAIVAVITVVWAILNDRKSNA